MLILDRRKIIHGDRKFAAWSPSPDCNFYFVTPRGVTMKFPSVPEVVTRMW
jgi:hypothetical protein